MSTPNPNYKPDENTEPAFPVFDSDHQPQYRDMTLRDWFAGQALAGFSADPTVQWTEGKNTEAVLAKLAYEVADAMMEARKK